MPQTAKTYAEFVEMIAALALEGPSVDIIDAGLHLYRCRHCGAGLRTEKKVGHKQDCPWVRADTFLNGA